jgi:type II secretory pathway component PulM
MLAEVLAVAAESWPLVAAGAAALLLIGVLLLVWQRQHTWREPVREYEREQRALAAFRDRLASQIGVRPPEWPRGRG